MFDVEIKLQNVLGAMAEMGEILGKAGVSVEGGGGWVVGDKGIMHFLVEDGAKAHQALTAAGIEVGAVKKVLVQRLNQEEPGQLGKIARAMATAGVNIEVVYSDHQNQLILVVDNFDEGKKVSDSWGLMGK